jgi:hypothetical protein
MVTSRPMIDPIQRPPDLKGGVRLLKVMKGHISSLQTNAVKLMETCGEARSSVTHQGEELKAGEVAFETMLQLWAVGERLHQLTNDIREQAGMDPVEKSPNQEAIWKGITRGSTEEPMEVVISGEKE